MPLIGLEGETKCPRCGSRGVTVLFTPPGLVHASRRTWLRNDGPQQQAGDKIRLRKSGSEVATCLRHKRAQAGTGRVTHLVALMPSQELENGRAECGRFTNRPGMIDVLHDDALSSRHAIGDLLTGQRERILELSPHMMSVGRVKAFRASQVTFGGAAASDSGRVLAFSSTAACVVVDTPAKPPGGS